MFLPLLAELKRRRVFRALLGYGVLAFALLQVAEPVMHGLHVPEWTLSFIVVALGFGFPVVVVLAWVFDVSESGIERTAALGLDARHQSLSGARLLVLLVGVGLIVAAPGVAWHFVSRGRGSVTTVPTTFSRPGFSSVAVLPFVNMSSNKDDEYFSDGITEELINALANVEELHVASRTSSFAFKDKNVSVRSIGEELRVGTVLEGSIRREGARLRVTAQLIDAATGHHLWSKTYDRDLKHVFELEDELAGAIVQSLVPKLVQAQPIVLVKTTTVSAAAHEKYLKGRYFWSKRTAQGLNKAIALFQEAIDLDPSYALAYVGKADSYILLPEYAAVPRAQVLAKARLAASKALALDGTAAEAFASMCCIDKFEGQWQAAERQCRRAIEIKPGYATAHHWYAILLLDTGRLSEARAEADRARQLDPTSLVINAVVSAILYYNREYDRAIEEMKKPIEMDPAFPVAHTFLGAAYLQKGLLVEAVTELQKARQLGNPGAGPLLSYAYAVSGQRSEAFRVLSELEEARTPGLESLRSCGRALIHLGLGNKDQAFVSLQQAILEGDACRIKVDPVWDTIRSDPRYVGLLKGMNLD